MTPVFDPSGADEGFVSTTRAAMLDVSESDMLLRWLRRSRKPFTELSRTALLRLRPEEDLVADDDSLFASDKELFQRDEPGRSKSVVLI
jgi:hypothetical protein